MISVKRELYHDRGGYSGEGTDAISGKMRQSVNFNI